MADKSDNDSHPPRAPPADAGQRIAKVMARAGLASRREAEAWIAARRVSVNGSIIESPSVKVGPKDAITVDGNPLPKRERTRLFLFHKPVGLVTTTADPEGRPTVFSALPSGLPRLISVGRLDINSEGLLLLTNDGGLARVLEHPQTGWLRRYRVRARGSVTQAQLDGLRDGISIAGVRYGPIDAVLDRSKGANAWLTVAIREGKNREVRSVVGALDLQVNRLIRISFGPFQLGDLPDGAIEEVPTRVLREQLGKKIAALADADFDAPLNEPEARRQIVARDRQPRAYEAGRRPDRAPAARVSNGEDRRDRGKGSEGRPQRPFRDADAGGAPSGQDMQRPARPRPWRGHGRDRPITEPTPDTDRPRKTTAGLLTDRKGRSVLVQRTRAEPPPEQPRRKSPPDRRRGPPDRRHGPRPSRPRPPQDQR
jgi:23S rRNA pseudouridine2605 synthase